MQLSVILCTHQPNQARLERVGAALCRQTLPVDRWETLLVDNASVPALSRESIGPDWPENLRILSAPELGLTPARRVGIQSAAADVLVFVDDDNVLAPDYLTQALAVMTAQPRLGLAGGPSRPEFDTPPPQWTGEFLGLLALRDLGPAPSLAFGLRRDGAELNEYPAIAPIGAGMVARRAALSSWLDQHDGLLCGRRGAALTSGEDNDIVFFALRDGWGVGYVPELSLQHLIPSHRLTRSYLARLNRGIQQSWVRVLLKHQASPWPSILAWTVPLRQAKAWFTHRAWSGPAAYVRWCGACGHFAGRARQSDT